MLVLHRAPPASGVRRLWRPPRVPYCAPSVLFVFCMRVTRVRDEANRCLELKAAFFVVSTGVRMVALWLFPADPASGPGHKLLWFWKVHIEIRVSVETNPQTPTDGDASFPSRTAAQLPSYARTHGKIDMKFADGRHWGAWDFHNITLCSASDPAGVGNATSRWAIRMCPALAHLPY